MIYLDNAATTKVAPEVIGAMMPYFTDEYGNAGTLYKLGRNAADAVRKAREQVSLLFGCSPDHVIFTSGGSEGNNMVFKGLRHRLSELGKKHLIVSAIEHDSVLRAAESLIEDGFYITYIKPDADGKVRARDIEDAIRPETGLVSIMYVNNEVGSVNDIKEIGDVCRVHGVLFHTDCVQAAGQYSIDVDRNCIDFATISSHKIHGPKGVGAIYSRYTNFNDPNGDFLQQVIEPLIHGGHEQEYGYRGGTENVPGIVGLGRAAELAVANMKEDMTEVSIFKQRFYMAIRDALKELGESDNCIHINGRSVIEPGKTLNFRFDGVDAETLLLTLDAKGICVSAGSACRSREAVPSHVLTAMGLSEDEARSSIRVSFSRYNQTDEVLLAGDTIARCAIALRGIQTVSEGSGAAMDSENK